MKNVKKIIIIICFIVILSMIIGITILAINSKKLSNNQNKPKEEINNKLDKTTSTKKQENDKKSPILILKKLSIKYGEEYSIDDFVQSCTDDSNIECILNYSDEDMGKITEIGTHNIEIIAIDNNGNEVKEVTELTILEEENTASNTINDNQNNKNLSTSENKISTSNNSKDNDVQNNKNTNSSNNQNTDSKKDNIGNNTKQEENNKITCSDKIKPNQNPTKSSNFIKYEKEEKVTNTTYKYGNKIETLTEITYAVYSDIGKCKYNENSYERIDKSTFSATTSDMKNEATSVLNSNLNTIKEVGIKTLNLYRKEVNKTDLEYDYELSLAATIRAMEMYHSGKFDHTRPNGSSCFTIYSELGIKYSAAGENIASNYGTLASAMVGWKNSPGHYANMISDYFTKVGIGYYEKYYVTLFK